MPDYAPILQDLARLDPDFPAFVAALPPGFTAAAPGIAVPGGLCADIVSVLRAQRPELAPWLDAKSSAPPEARFADPLVIIPVVTAAIFLLRSHITYADGRWTFEHKPMSDGLLSQVLEKLKEIMRPS
jgi:hypothetical protein